MVIRETRRIKISKAGYWYILLSLGMGFLAISSGNNILYLLESFLLGGLILSGVLSEWAVSSIELDWILKQAIAGQPTKDLLVIKNKSRLPLYCIEIGVWKAGSVQVVHFIPELLPRQKLNAVSSQVFTQRGAVTWEAVSIACDFPFGFAKKIRNLYHVRKLPYARKVWPKALKTSRTTNIMTNQQMGSAQSHQYAPGTHISEGEIRPLQPGEDYRYVVWTLSAKRGEPFVRTRQAEKNQLKLYLRLKNSTSEQLDRQVSELATVIYQTTDLQSFDQSVQLIIEGDVAHSRNFFGAQNVLNELAIAEAPNGGKG